MQSIQKRRFLHSMTFALHDTAAAIFEVTAISGTNPRICKLLEQVKGHIKNAQGIIKEASDD